VLLEVNNRYTVVLFISLPGFLLLVLTRLVGSWAVPAAAVGLVAAGRPPFFISGRTAALNGAGAVEVAAATAFLLFSAPESPYFTTPLLVLQQKQGQSMFQKTNKNKITCYSWGIIFNGKM
jgi:hypothetical protein